MSLLGLVLLGALGLWWLVAQYRGVGLSRVAVRWWFTPDRVFPGDRCTLTIRVDHWGPWRLSWLKLVWQLPKGLVIPGSGPEGLVVRLRPWPGRGVVRHYPFAAPGRGHYRLDRVIGETGDPFGLVAYGGPVEGAAELLVYPELSRVAADPAAAGLLGELERPSLLEDPTVYAGVRDYRPGDPLRRIHWPQTARTGRVVVKLHPTTHRLAVWLVLNLATEEPYWRGVDRPAVEAAIARTASLAHHLLGRGIPTGLLVNGVAFEATALTRLAPGAGSGQLPALLALLGRLAPYPATAPERLLQEAAGLPWEDSLVLISPVLPERWRPVLARLAGQRPLHLHPVAWAAEPPVPPTAPAEATVP